MRNKNGKTDIISSPTTKIKYIIYIYTYERDGWLPGWLHRNAQRSRGPGFPWQRRLRTLANREMFLLSYPLTHYSTIPLSFTSSITPDTFWQGFSIFFFYLFNKGHNKPKRTRQMLILVAIMYKPLLTASKYLNSWPFIYMKKITRC